MQGSRLAARKTAGYAKQKSRRVDEEKNISITGDLIDGIQLSTLLWHRYLATSLVEDREAESEQEVPKRHDHDRSCQEDAMVSHGDLPLLYG